MVVCKFFLQGNCRYGEHCKFDHEVSSQNMRNENFVRLQHQGPQTPNDVVDTDTLITSVRNDMLILERSGQWILSCYAPFKEKQLFPGFHDQSFEEVRLCCYEAKKNNTFESYVQQLQQALIEAKNKFKALETPNREVIELLRNMYDTPISVVSTKNENILFQEKSFTGRSPLNNDFNYGPNRNDANPNLSSKFNKEKSESSGGSIFGQTFTPQEYNGSLFGQQNEMNRHSNFYSIENTNQQNPNGQISNDNNSSHVEQTMQTNIFSDRQSTFVPPTNQNQTQNNMFLFANKSNIFYGQNNEPSIYTNSIFPQGYSTNSLDPNNQTSVKNNINSIFGKSINQIQNSPVVGQTNLDKDAYSRIEDLEEADIDWFKNNNVSISNIPEKAPTYEMCL